MKRDWTCRSEHPVGTGRSLGSLALQGLSIVAVSFLFLLSLQSEETVRQPTAVVTTLAQEREDISAEIENEVLYDPVKAKEAAARLRQVPQEQSPARNVADAMAAFASVDDRFAAAMQLLKEKRFTEAAEASEKLINPTARSYFSTAARWGRGRPYLWRRELRACPPSGFPVARGPPRYCRWASSEPCSDGTVDGGRGSLRQSHSC